MRGCAPRRVIQPDRRTKLLVAHPLPGWQHFRQRELRAQRLALEYSVPMAGKPDADLAKVLADLAIEMQSHPDTETTLQSIVEGAVAIVPGARWAGVSLIQGRAIEPRVPSDPLVAKLDALQSELNEGPSLSSLREYRTVLINDMAGESRWPRFCQRSLELG